jgi:hypothetical protein
MELEHDAMPIQPPRIMRSPNTSDGSGALEYGKIRADTFANSSFLLIEDRLAAPLTVSEKWGGIIDVPSQTIND